MLIRLYFCAVLAMVAAPLASAQVAPEPPSAIQRAVPMATGERMVVTAHRLASEAARAMLDKGGNAVDAAIAAQIMLTLVEPQSSGIGGGGFMLHYDAARNRLTSYDGRETAPQGVTPALFLDAHANPIPFMDAVRDAKSVGVPGLLAMLYKAHNAHGALPWKTLFAPTIERAQRGFAISPRLHTSIAYAAPHPMSDAWRSVYLTPTGQPKAAGTLLRNPALAETLHKVADHGPSAFYQGSIAADIVATLSARNSSIMLEDLASYRALERSALCGNYHLYRICSVGPPSSGGVALLQTLGILAHVNYPDRPSPQAIHLLLEAQKIAFADRERYVAEQMPVEVSQLLDEAYLKKRAAEIDIARASSTPAAAGIFGAPYADGHHADMPSTTHISIVDRDGHAVSMTSSIEHSFGSGMMVGGFMLNNQLTDFSFLPSQDGLKVANAVAPNTRPRSSMTPTMIFAPDGTLYAVLGSPGGSAIIGYVTKTILALLHWRMPLDQAIAYGHAMHNNRHATLENGQEILADSLRAMGHDITLTYHTSGVHAIVAYGREAAYQGAADPRREGVPLGD
jgi:gamma-glutamyltranspeptidase/glutathione hydrolase